jgi:signal transduction histidine kinase
MTTNHKRFFKKCDEIISKLKSGLKVQRSSGNVLTFIVQDLLDYAQMRSGKFRKNIQEFNIKDAVEDVMLI